jgi:hypothetical protein
MGTTESIAARAITGHQDQRSWHRQEENLIHYLVDDRDGGIVQFRSSVIAAEFVADGWRETTEQEYAAFRAKLWGIKEDKKMGRQEA